MTTTTRTTKGRTAKVLTALMAVFGVLVAMLMVSAPAASADDDSDHGQNKITICHFVHGNGETKDGYNIISIAERAWYHGHSDGEDDATKNWTHDDRDVVYDGKACPTIPTVTGYGEAQLFHGLLCWDEKDYGPFATKEYVVTLPDLTMDQTAANLLAQGKADKMAQEELDSILSDFPEHSDGTCDPDRIVGTGTGNYTHGAFCSAGQDFPGYTLPKDVKVIALVDGDGKPFTDQATADAYATAKAQSEAQTLVTTYMDTNYPGHTDGVCTPPGTDVTRSYTVNGTADFCPVGGTETVTVTYTGSGTATKATEAEALAAAQGLAELAAKADLASKTPADVTSGACTPVTPEVVAPVEPGTVAPVEAATVAVPAAATVPVPTSAPLPATVPAGDGSSVPQLPILGWVLVVLATTALAVSAVRLAAGSTR